MRPDYARITAGGVTWWTSDEFLPRIRQGPFADFERVRAGARLVKDLRSKRTLEFDDAATTWIIKVYKPGSVWRKLASIVRGTRARHELQACRAVLRLGIPTVPVAAAAQWKGGSAVVFEKLAGWTSVELELRAAPRRELLSRYGYFARRVHDAGILQDDFNPSNVLIKGGDLRLIDFERLRVLRSLSESRRLRLVAKLLRLKSVGRDGLDAFLDGYLRSGEDREKVLARIQAFGERQARIDRTRLARNCVRDNRNFGAFEAGDYLGFFRKAYEGRDGMTTEQAATLPARPEGLTLHPHDNALSAWKEANLLAQDGGPTPLAVLRERGGRRGFVAYRG